MSELGSSLMHPGERAEGDLDTLIQQYEKQLGTQLPADYREFLSEFGGTTLGDFYEAPITEAGPDGGSACPRIFFGFYRLPVEGPPHPFDLGGNLMGYRERVPSGLIPIADALGGNLIVMSVVPGSKGEVYYWDHETADVWFVATSFDEFMKQLQLNDEDDDDKEDDD